MKKVIDDILEKNTKLCTCREVYKLNEDLEITIDQKGNKVTMWGFNNQSERSLNLSTKRFERLMKGFKAVSSDLYADSKYYYITIDTSKKESRDDKSYEVEIEELNKKIACLNDIIARLEARNNRLEQEVNKYKDLDDLKKNSLIHNVRGAGRKAKFTDKQIDEIKKMRAEGTTIKEIAIKYNCSVGLIYKLINEN